MKQIIDALKFYYATAILKENLRQGGVQWKVERETMETIADHVYGTLMLAIGLNSQLKPNIDFSKTFLMIAIHETEEILIGDFTPLDKITIEEKRNVGDKAVSKIFSILENSSSYIDLLNEFNDCQSEEAKFAKACDKLEYVLEFKKYVDAGQTGFEKVTEDMLKNKHLRAYYESGKYDLADVFYLYHMKAFEYLGFTENLWYEEIKPMSTCQETIKNQLN